MRTLTEYKARECSTFIELPKRVSADSKSSLTARANCGRFLLLISLFWVVFSSSFLFRSFLGRFLLQFSFWVVFSCSFQFRNAAVNVAEAGSDVRLRGAQMEEVCNSRVKEINFSMRALFPLSCGESRLGGDKFQS